MIRLLAILVFAASWAGVASTRSPAPVPVARDRAIVGYVFANGRTLAPGDVDVEKLTHVNYAFGKIGPDHRLTFNAGPALNTVYAGDCTEPGCPHGLFSQITRLKKAHSHLKFLISVGGWTDSGPFYAMAASAVGAEYGPMRTSLGGCARISARWRTKKCFRISARWRIEGHP